MLIETLFHLIALQSTFNRDVSHEITLPSGTLAGTVYGWGPAGRKADHATVAINSERDVMVAYHTDRDDIGAPFGLKQVEVAMFRYDANNDAWSHSGTALVGSVEHFPLSPDVFQNIGVRCERPDVIAVGDRFFVTWSRIYDRTTQAEEPTVLECAWITWSNSQQKFVVVGGGSAGKGFALDFNGNDHDHDILTLPTALYSRECAGVQDAVVLRENLSGLSTVGVAYAHQYEFGDYPSVDNIRRCDLRFIACSFDGFTITRNVPQAFITAIEFDGITGSGGTGNSAGFILPDLARGFQDGRFILAFEEQKFLSPGGPDYYGLIRLQAWQYDFATSAVTTPVVAAHTFGSASSPVVRRRPNVHTWLTGGSGTDVFSIAFNKEVGGTDQDVVYELWQFGENGSYRIPFPIGEGWYNPPGSPGFPVNDFRPTPVHGTTQPLFRRCLAERALPGGVCQLLEYEVDADPNNNGTPLVLLEGPQLGRLAASYQYVSGASAPHYTALTWEGPGSSTPNLQIWLRIRD